MTHLKFYLIITILFLTNPEVSFGQAAEYPNGSTLPDFELIDIYGEVYTLNEIVATGQYVLIEAFTAVCGPDCQEVAPIFNQMYETYGCNKGDVFVISVEVGTANAATTLAYDIEFGGDFAHSPIVPGLEGDNISGWLYGGGMGIVTIPTYVLIGPDKIMVNNDIWPVTDISDFIDAFPDGETPTEMPCNVDLTEEEPLIQLSLFPNPVSSELNIEFTSSNNSLTTIKIINMLGVTIQIEEINVETGLNEHRIDVSALTSGQYMIQVISNEVVSLSQFQKG